MEAAIAKSPDAILHSELANFKALLAKSESDPQQLFPAEDEISAMARTCQQLGDGPAAS
jgi:hypothetical protein